MCFHIVQGLLLMQPSEINETNIMYVLYKKCQARLKVPDLFVYAGRLQGIGIGEINEEERDWLPTCG